MKKVLFIAMLSIVIMNTKAQGLYDVSKISPVLLKNASLVIRNEERIYDLKSPGRATMSYKTAITILNKNGEAASNMTEYYDQFSKIYNLKATLYDAAGNKVRDYKSADFKDQSAVSEGSLYQDSRLKHLEFLHTSTPYTIAYSYDIDFNGIRAYPTWNPVYTWDCAVEQSSYTFKIPNSLSFKYRSSKGLKTDSAQVKDKIEYKWSCQDIPAIEYEPLSIGITYITPWVSLAPNQFEYDNSKANIENWNSMGAWLFSLNNGIEKLTEAHKAKVQDIVKNAGSDKEKVRLLYQYLQQNTRYVSVQLGIGGYRPINAEKVSAVNYGDCKGLSNYMKAMLQEAGIKSDLVVIGNGLPSLNKDFASMNQANHMILHVPLEKETIWLECTSSYVPLGFIGNGNSDKTVLLVTENGGKLEKTPTYSSTDNYLKRITNVDLKEDGTANVRINAKYGYSQFEENMVMMLLDPTQQRKKLLNRLSIPNVQLNSVNYSQPDKTTPVLDEKITLNCSDLLASGGGKLFLTLNLLNRQETSLITMENRKTPFTVSYSYLDEDEIIYTIPKGYKVEFIPKDVQIDSEFGQYAAKAVVKDNTIIYTRTKTIKSNKYPAEKYNDYIAFQKKLSQADKQKGILAKID